VGDLVCVRKVKKGMAGDLDTVSIPNESEWRVTFISSDEIEK
jgi:hypothetical protein